MMSVHKMDYFLWKIEDMRDEEGNSIEVANKARQIFTARLGRPVEPKDMIRKKID